MTRVRSSMSVCLAGCIVFLGCLVACRDEVASRVQPPSAFEMARDDAGSTEGGATEAAKEAGTQEDVPSSPADASSSIGADTAVTADADAGAAAEPAQPASSSPCPELCARVEAAACPSQKPCLVACEAAIAEPSCGARYLPWATCAAQQPAALFTCDRRGQAALEASHCAEELMTFGDCLLGGG